jgi:hypothetical protein
VHIVAALILGSLVWRFPIGRLAQLKERWLEPKERLTYVRVAPAAPASPARADTGAARPGAGQRRGEVPRGGDGRAPAPFRAPTGTPTELPPPTSSSGAPGGVSGGTGTGGDGRGGAVAGVTPGYGDPRLWAPAGPFTPAAKTPAQRVDSAIKAAFGVYADSVRVAEANRGRAPGDWTVKKGDQTWGVDPKWIHLGKVKLPTALLAMLPLNAQANPQELERSRKAAAIRSDILFQANRAMSEDDFRKAVQRIRERKERERKEQHERDAREPIATP